MSLMPGAAPEDESLKAGPLEDKGTSHGAHEPVISVGLPPEEKTSFPGTSRGGGPGERIW